MTALAVSFQSNRIGWATVARSAGLSRLGADGVGGGVGGAGGAGGSRRAANWNTPSRAAESCTVVVADANVVTTKLALVAPPGMVTLSGTLAVRGRLLPRFTATPPAGAGLATVTVPVAGVPPVTVVGLTVRDVSSGRLGYSVTGRDSVTPPPLTEIMTLIGAVTGAVVMGKNPTPLPAKTVTVLGTEASAGLLLVTRRS